MKKNKAKSKYWKQRIKHWEKVNSPYMVWICKKELKKLQGEPD